jgi:hypothetical protein
MRNLIGQHPNLVPTGLGHSNSTVAAGVIIPGAVSASEDGVEQEEEEDEDGTSSILLNEYDHAPGDSPGPTTGKRSFSDFDGEKSEFDDDGAGPGSGDDYMPTSPTALESGDAAPEGDEAVDGEEEKEGRKKGKKAHAHPKNPAKPSTSKPAQPTAAAAPKPSKKTKMTEFSEIALSEEQTRQKAMDLALLRTRQQMHSTQVRGRINERREERKSQDRQAKREERLMKLRIKEMKMKHDYEVLHMCASLSSASHAASGFFDTRSFSSRSSEYAASEFDNFSFDGFTGNAVAGPSTLQDEYAGNDFSFSESNAGNSSLPDN